MHQLGFELPDRTGFGGLWSAMDERPDDEAQAAPTASAPQRHLVTVSRGPRSRRVRTAIAALERAVAA